VQLFLVATYYKSLRKSISAERIAPGNAKRGGRPGQGSWQGMLFFAVAYKPVISLMKW